MKIIQFPHPGKEHKYTKLERSEGEKYWNKKGKHARNFIHAELHRRTSYKVLPLLRIPS